MREKELSEEHSPSDVKQALAIASKMGGNMTGATAAIEKKRKGLSKHKQVAAVLKRANEEVKEGLGELAHAAERDHEVQMARAELYKLAKYAIKLHEILKGVSESEGLEGWVQAKITKSADMIGSVYHHLDYQESPMADESMIVGESKVGDTCSCCDSKIDEAGKCGCDSSCGHCGGQHNVTEGKYKNDAQRKAVHASKDEKKNKYKESLQAKLSAKLGK